MGLHNPLRTCVWALFIIVIARAAFLEPVDQNYGDKDRGSLPLVIQREPGDDETGFPNYGDEVDDLMFAIFQYILFQ